MTEEEKNNLIKKETKEFLALLKEIHVDYTSKMETLLRAVEENNANEIRQSLMKSKKSET